MARIKLTIEYDGTDYVGWQVQPNGVSVQQQVESALQQLLGSPVRVHSSGRTDAGVHALGMVCHLDTQRDLPLSAWRDGLNRFLPIAIAVRQAEFAADDFHARYSAKGKRYRYTLLRDDVRSPLQRRTSWQVRQSLDLQLMTLAAQTFVGVHDFAAFRTSGCAAETTQREVFAVEMIEEGRLLHIDISGSGFLKNMVRMMVGTLVEVGRGKRPPEDVAKLLKNDRQIKPALTAPAQGLCLLEVWY
ncbi:tRNA pseudouridine38-40 synthase [Malonomonas rubra DSM 5091]|uniref:tRNA pseudouridine synthase A n=1 Tax=Malonomonas rubra DSM 5091 TaxID=1122189 RepID=A0A1M6CFV8_MALRU|nr:tRNA pseudouridine(38-40) synthase TruA [Malonomonas rubra]SHI59568.1 tRNA pseudouridine38-40 synthase [Malonomonas rubra DSM 5091]